MSTASATTTDTTTQNYAYAHDHVFEKIHQPVDAHASILYRGFTPSGRIAALPSDTLHCSVFHPESRTGPPSSTAAVVFYCPSPPGRLNGAYRVG
jgi:hypothetical protein